MLEDPPSFHHLADAELDDLRGVAVGDRRTAVGDRPVGDLAVLGRKQAGDRLERGRLAGAVRPEKCHDLAVADGERQPSQDEDHLLIDHLDVLELEH